MISNAMKYPWKSQICWAHLGNHWIFPRCKYEFNKLQRDRPWDLAETARNLKHFNLESFCGLQLFGFVGLWALIQKKDLKRYGCLIRLWLYQWLLPWNQWASKLNHLSLNHLSLISKPSTFRTISMSRRTSVLMETHLSSWKHTLLLKEKLHFTKLPLSFIFFESYTVYISIIYIYIHLLSFMGFSNYVMLAMFQHISTSFIYNHRYNHIHQGLR